MYRMVLVGALGVPTYLIAAYRMSNIFIGQNNEYQSNSILFLLVMSPLVVIVFYFMYMSEHEAMYKYGRYLRYLFDKIDSENYYFWEQWVGRERLEKANYKFEIHRGFAVYLLIFVYYIVSILFGFGASLKICNNLGISTCWSYVVLVGYVVTGALVLVLSSQYGAPLMSAIFGRVSRYVNYGG